MRRAQPWNTEESEGNMSSVIYPRDFFERQVRMDPKLCFVLSPFKAKYEGIRKAVDAIVTQCGFKAVHAMGTTVKPDPNTSLIRVPK